MNDKWTDKQETYIKQKSDSLTRLREAVADAKEMSEGQDEALDGAYSSASAAVERLQHVADADFESAVEHADLALSTGFELVESVKQDSVS